MTLEAPPPFSYSPASDEVRRDDLPLKVQDYQLAEYLGHDVLGSALGSDAEVPLGALEGAGSFRHRRAASSYIHWL